MPKAKGSKKHTGKHGQAVLSRGARGSLVTRIASGSKSILPTFIPFGVPNAGLLVAKPGRKRICVDIAADNVGSLEELRIRLDEILSKVVYRKQTHPR